MIDHVSQAWGYGVVVLSRYEDIRIRLHDLLLSILQDLRCLRLIFVKVQRLLQDGEVQLFCICDFNKAINQSVWVLNKRFIFKNIELARKVG